MQLGVHHNPYNNSTTSFKSNISLDIGGSQREGSCKIYYAATELDDTFYKEDTTVNEVGKSGFKDSEDFIDHLVKKIGRVQNDNKKTVKDMCYGEDENTINNVAIFIPSYTTRDFAYWLPNHRNLNNKPLRDLDFSHFRERLETQGIDVAPNMKFKVLQDAMGTGLAMAKRLREHGMLTEGKYYTACITGGGCGISNIEVVDKDTVIVKSSGSSYLSQSLSLQKVSKAGASAPAVIENFCRGMLINDEDIEAIKGCHKAEFTMSPRTTFEKNVKTERLKKLLVETEKFEVEKEDDKEYTIKVKDEYIDQYDLARRNAIERYCLALARLAIIKKTEGSNGMIITGKLAKGINETSKREYGKGISEIVMQHLSQSFNTDELQKMQKTYNFTVMCDKRFDISNNTECGNIVHCAEFVNPERGNWLRLKMKDIDDSIRDNAVLSK